MRQCQPMDSRSGARPPQVRPRPASSGRAAPVRTRPVTPSPTRLARLPPRRAPPRAAAAGPGGDGRVDRPPRRWASCGSRRARSGRPSTARSRGLRRVRQLGGQRRRQPRADAAADHRRRPDRRAARRGLHQRRRRRRDGERAGRRRGRRRATPSACGSRSRTASRELVEEVPVGPTSVLVIPEVELEKGRNDIQASIMGPGGESELSAVADWILDQSQPEHQDQLAQGQRLDVEVRRDRQGQDAGRAARSGSGTTTTAPSATAIAGKDGLFEARIGIDNGINTLTITAHRPGRQPEHGDDHRASGLRQDAGDAHRVGVPVQRQEAAQDRSRSPSS